jgi:hypothetical protein
MHVSKKGFGETTCYSIEDKIMEGSSLQIESEVSGHRPLIAKT